jgi:hypothetical protein
MEEDLRYRYESPTKQIDLVKQRLEEAVDKATEKLNYESAHDKEILRSLEVVASFIRKKKRVCYGGTAMNAILPDSKKFYDPRVDLPDYDFYTPDVDGDIEELVQLLKREGFKEVYHKVGIHEGTKKILVNFMPVADISAIEPELFAVLLRRSILKEGMHYTDENILRMMMYLELSRPKGMPSRWTKVFERLQLINDLFPIKGCGSGKHDRLPAIPFDARKIIIDHIIEWKRILCNGPIVQLYTHGITKRNAKFRVQDGGAVLFTSPDPKADALLLKKAFPYDDIVLFRHAARGELVPNRIEIKRGKQTLCVIVEEGACHSYVRVPTPDGRTIYVGSLEFLITLYLSLQIFTTHSEDVLGSHVQCYIKRFIELEKKNYLAKKSQFPAFPIECRGHQTKFSSLLRKKVERIKREKKDSSSTRKHTAKRHSKTRRRKHSGAIE